MTVINFVFKQDGPIDVQERYGEVIVYERCIKIIMRKVEELVPIKKTFLAQIVNLGYSIFV
jgi:hypothetical protein